MLPQVTGLHVVTQDRATGTTVFGWDATPEADAYVVVLGGQPVGQVSGLSITLTLHPGSYTLGVAPVAFATPPTPLRFTVPQPTPTLKPLLVGPLFRGAPVASWVQYFGGAVSEGPAQGALGADQIFSASGVIIPNNPLVQQVAAVRAVGRDDYGLKARVEFGIHAPANMKSLNGAPVTMTDPTTSKTNTVPRWWEGGAYETAEEECYAALAPYIEATPEIRSLVFGPGTFYCEPDIRQFAQASNVTALRNAGYTTALDLAFRERQFTYLKTLIATTRLAQAFNAYQAMTATGWQVQTAETSALVALMVETFGAQASIENNSVRSGSIQYPVLYNTDMPAARAAGAGVAIQLAAVAQVGNEFTAAMYAAQTLHATSIELTTAFAKNLTVAQVQQIMAACQANV